MSVNEKGRSIREFYGSIAKAQSGCGCGAICGGDARKYAGALGYTGSELEVIPDEANLALGCGNPTALAGLKEGEVVLDLGSGAGFNCFLAADRVGPAGKVIGVDMTPEMVERARAIARKDGFTNVEFRLGEIENLPAADNSVDVVISNCVINLSADKGKVFREINRVLKPGGRVAISDLVLKKELPVQIRDSVEAYVGCVAGALLLDSYRELAETSGLTNVKITEKDISAMLDNAAQDQRGKAILEGFAEGGSIADYVASIYVEGRK